MVLYLITMVKSGFNTACLIQGRLQQPQERPSTHHALSETAITNITYESRISPVDMKLICDYHYGSLKQPPEYMETLRKMKIRTAPGDITREKPVIFVDSDAVHTFLKDIAPHIEKPFVLVSGDSDTSIPETMETATMADKLIRRGQLLHWYAMNCQISIIPGHFTCLPNGISQWGQQREAMQSAFEKGIGLFGGLKQNLNQTKKEVPMALMAFHVGSNKEEREPLMKLGCDETMSSSLKGLVECSYTGLQGKDQLLEFYRYVSTFKFIFSPHGVGLDCFRTYETLYLGSYPIVKTSSLDQLYDGLPVLIVRQWTDVTKVLLDETFRKFQSMDFDYSKLYRQYWHGRFRSHFLI